jgi:hypothetical protein
MRPLFTAFTIASLYCSTCVAQSDSMVVRKHYPIKSCQIVFRFINGPQSGTKTVIFDDWGNKEKEEVVTTTDTASMRKGWASLEDSSHQDRASAFQNNLKLAAVQHNLKITVGGQRYIIDLDTHVGAKSPVYLFGGTLDENMKQMGFSFVRSDTLLGKLCRVWEQPGGFSLWVWNNYVVKKQIIQGLSAGMRLEEYAIKIDESYSIRPDEFKIPDNIKFN